MEPRGRLGKEVRGVGGGELSVEGLFKDCGSLLKVFGFNLDIEVSGRSWRDKFEDMQRCLEVFEVEFPGFYQIRLVFTNFH